MTTQDTVIFFTFRVPNNTTYKIGKALVEGHQTLFLSPRFNPDTLSFSPNTKLLGFGDFTKTAMRMRIETQAVNRYGKKPLLTKGPEEVSIFYDFSFDQSQAYLSRIHTNGPCNRAMYLLSQKFSPQNTAFIHVPKNFSIDRAKEYLTHCKEEWIRYG